MWTLILTGLLASLPAPQGDELRVLPPGSKPREMLGSYLRKRAHDALRARQATLEAELKDPAKLRERQRRLRAAFRAALGGFPQRTPLNARILAAEDRRGYRLEKLIYESQPGFHVTALLYLPTGQPPYPGVLVPCGHSRNGKAALDYQRACILLATNGMAALCYDPIEQGERLQLLDRKGRGVLGGTLGHTLIGARAILLGRSMATFRIWDGMRGIDYLCGREDIDASKIGCSGNSGGGTLTAYLMALDERVACAAPSCYLTSLERLIDTIGPQDAEQNIPGQLSFGMDHGDYVIMRAPRPTLICCKSGDFFDIRGTWESFREAKRAYTILGAPERVDLVEAPGEHGFHKPLREAMVAWMKRWLLGRDEAVAEGDLDVLSEEDARCTPTGQVLDLEGERSLFEILREEVREFAPGEDRSPQASPEPLPPFSVRRIAGSIRRAGYHIEKLILVPEEGIELPALHFVPGGEVERVVLFLDDEGKHRDAAVGGRIEALVKSGARVLAVDLRGWGEMSRPRRSRWDRLVGAQWKEFFLAHLLGEDLDHLRQRDIRVATRFLLDSPGKAPARGIHLLAMGKAAAPALAVARFEPDLYAGLELIDYLPSWKTLLEHPLAPDQLVQVSSGVLNRWDLPNLIYWIPKEKLLLGKPMRLPALQ